MRIILLKESDPFFSQEQDIKTLKELTKIRDSYKAHIQLELKDSQQAVFATIMDKTGKMQQ